MKRLFDLSLSLVGLTILLPVLLLVAAAVWAASGRPVFFSQGRVGRNGHPFRLVKFRTMVVSDGVEGTSITVWGDPRITPLGRFLRRTKLDELPQLWNVVRGEMSLVGPRPEVPEIVEGYSPEMLEIFSVRPGITSIASLLLSDEEDLLALAPDSERAYREVLVPFKVELGMEHVRRNSLFFDISVLSRTAWRLTLGRVFTPEKDPRVNVLEKRIKEKGASE
jgi:lipopolysaccharide/colanic/teichoic acid biosynthesis glycosyltransferase